MDFHWTLSHFVFSDLSNNFSTSFLQYLKNKSFKCPAFPIMFFNRWIFIHLGMYNNKTTGYDYHCTCWLVWCAGCATILLQTVGSSTPGGFKPSKTSRLASMQMYEQMVYSIGAILYKPCLKWQKHKQKPFFFTFLPRTANQLHTKTEHLICNGWGDWDGQSTYLPVFTD